MSKSSIYGGIEKVMKYDLKMGEECAYNTAEQESEKAMQNKKDAPDWINKPPPEPGERLSWLA
eukprot:13832706-Alexandrium_andersonii.AAC.1